MFLNKLQSVVSSVTEITKNLYKHRAHFVRPFICG
nr:MAG TPA: hypothetical protein [Caudoviricetes sp.]